MQIIDNNNDLISYCNAIQNYEFITVDTEFLREKTYFPKLCLIQVSTPDLKHSAIIDPLADIDLQPLWQIFLNPNIVKVLHSASQDLEIFYYHMKTMPVNVFDTQIGACALGFGEQIGYDNLVKSICDEQIDKGARFTDWSIRPLKDTQLNYAIADVTHLVKIYTHIKSEIDNLGRNDWIKSDMETMTNESSYKINPETTYKKIKFRTNKREVLAIIRELSAWRETSAMNRDIPKRHFMKDETIIDIASSKIKSAKDLSKVRNFPKPWVDSDKSKKILDMLQKVKNMNESEYPEIPKSTPLTEGQKASLDLLRSLLKECASNHNVAPALIAKSSDLDNFIRNPNNSNLIKGWKFDVFGKRAVDLINGKIALAIKENKLQFIDI